MYLTENKKKSVYNLIEVMYMNIYTCMWTHYNKAVSLIVISLIMPSAFTGYKQC